MNRNPLYALLAVLVVAVGVLGYLYYQEQQEKAGIDISVGDNGLSVETQ